MSAINFKNLRAVFLVFFLITNFGFSQIQSIIIFKTSFEIEEGYNPQYTLVGQNGWTGQGSGWNGLLTDELYFPGFGQQAYIGYSNFSPVSTATIIWRPLNFQYLTNYPIIKFSVIFQIKDSSNGRYDDFRWSVYNTNDQRLFSVDFDNETLHINYSLDTTGEFFSTGYSFFNDGTYRLTIAMNIPQNRWIAEINDTPITPSLPMTTKGYDLTIGDIDASWVLHDPQKPGDNYMVFDEFTVTAETVSPLRLEVSKTTLLTVVLKLFGEPAINYRVQSSTNLINWYDFCTNTMPSYGTILITNIMNPGKPVQFFRGCK